MRNLEFPGRSPVLSARGMAATSHPLATEAAIDLLKQGGNALDAAIGACAVQCVVEPHSTGIGGDCFCFYAPGGNIDSMVSRGIKSIERQSPHSVTVPGAVDAWCRLNKDHGSLSLEEILQHAINYASNGYPVSSRVSYDQAKQLALPQRLKKSAD